MGISKAIILNTGDNTATALEEIAPDAILDLPGEPDMVAVSIKQSIPLGHKFATRDISMGEVVLKYGEVIGVASQDIEIGEHVHIHNIESVRGRGDKT